MVFRSICRSAVVFLLFIDVATAKVETVLGGIALKDNPNLVDFVPNTSAPEIMISRSQYVISYNRARRSPNWVAWKLEANQLGSTGRSNNFLQDAELEKYLESTGGPFAVDSHEYTGSCFDRGHQVPSGDRTDSPTNNETTFMMSNMVPQTAFLNRDIWEHLEHYTRSLVQHGKKVYVVAGPVYDEDFGAIGPKQDIPVPSKNFKIIVVLDANQTPKDITAATPVISVMMPNVLADGSKPTDHEALCRAAVAGSSLVGGTNWEPFKTTIPEIEKASGLHFDQLIF
jgi:endonuclease G